MFNSTIYVAIFSALLRYLRQNYKIVKSIQCDDLLYVYIVQVLSHGVN